MIQTLTEKINKSEIKKGFILAHEHLDFDLRRVRKDNDSFFHNVNLISKELEIAVDQGLVLIIEVSNQSMIPKKNNLLKISQKLQIPIVTATGYYLNEYELNNNKTIKELETEFRSHILEGIGPEKIKCGIIGEIGTSSNKIYDFEKRVFTAAVNVQKQLGVSIYTHINLGKIAQEHLNLLIKLQAIPNKTIIGHSEFITKPVLTKFLKKGFIIGIDTIGKKRYCSDERRALLLVNLIKNGYEDQIVLSLDISKQSYLKHNGQHGYGWLIDSFYPLVKNKITIQQWRKITFDNILKIIDF